MCRILSGAFLYRHICLVAMYLGDHVRSYFSYYGTFLANAGSGISQWLPWNATFTNVLITCPTSLFQSEHSVKTCTGRSWRIFYLLCAVCVAGFPGVPRLPRASRWGGGVNQAHPKVQQNGWYRAVRSSSLCSVVGIRGGSPSRWLRTRASGHNTEMGFRCLLKAESIWS